MNLTNFRREFEYVGGSKATLATSDVDPAAKVCFSLRQHTRLRALSRGRAVYVEGPPREIEKGRPAYSTMPGSAAGIIM